MENTEQFASGPELNLQEEGGTHLLWFFYLILYSQYTYLTFLAQIPLEPSTGYYSPQLCLVLASNEVVCVLHLCNVLEYDMVEVLQGCSGKQQWWFWLNKDLYWCTNGFNDAGISFGNSKEVQTVEQCNLLQHQSLGH